MRFHPLLLLAALLVACAGGIDPNMNADDKTDDVDDPAADAGPQTMVDARPTPDLPTVPDAGPRPDASPPMPDAGPTAPVEVLADPGLDVTPLDGQHLHDACQARAPWGSASWGIQGFTTSDAATQKLSDSYFDVDKDYMYMYGEESVGRVGIIRLIQGDVWGGTPCAAKVPWHVFTPVAVGGKRIVASVDLFPTTPNPETADNYMVKMAVSLWFSSPDMPKAGGDRNQRKPLVLDLVFHVECTSYESCQLTETRSAELPTAYHYSEQVIDAPFYESSTFELDVSTALADAVREFKLEGAASTLKLYQAEVAVTMRNAGAGVGVDHFGITVR